jgi:hypothetical protein
LGGGIVINNDTVTVAVLFESSANTLEKALNTERICSDVDVLQHAPSVPPAAAFVDFSLITPRGQIVDALERG